MSPKKWHYRVPFYGKEINDTAIIANGNTPEVMGQELQYAQDHGIKFWAFCNYPIGCKDPHPPASECVRIQCFADNTGKPQCDGWRCNVHRLSLTPPPRLFSLAHCLRPSRLTTV